MSEEAIEPTAAPAEVVARVQTISDAKALKRHFAELFKHGQPRYADFYDSNAEPWNLLPELIPDFVEGWQPIDFDGEGERTAIAMALTLSMPSGTDHSSNEGAALALARKEFGNREHVWIAGDHKGPFVKFLVQYRNDEDEPLAPGPSELRRYREIYAQELCARSIPAQATTRGSRGLGFGEVRNAYQARNRRGDPGRLPPRDQGERKLD